MAGTEFDALFDAIDAAQAGKSTRVVDTAAAAQRAADAAQWAERGIADLRRIRVHVALLGARDGLTVMAKMPAVAACEKLANVPTEALLTLKLVPDPFEFAIATRDAQARAKAPGAERQKATYMGQTWRNQCWEKHILPALSATFGGTLVATDKPGDSAGDVSARGVYDLMPVQYIDTDLGPVRIKSAAKIVWTESGIKRAAALFAGEPTWRNIVAAIVDGINAGRAPRDVLNQVRDRYEQVAAGEKGRRAAVANATK